MIILKVIFKSNEPIFLILWNLEHTINGQYVHICVYIFTFWETDTISSSKLQLNMKFLTKTGVPTLEFQLVHFYTIPAMQPGINRLTNS